MIAATELYQEGPLSFQQAFARQYCLSKNALPDIDGWISPKPIGGWSLVHCPKLTHVLLKDGAGKTVGWLLGVAVDRDGALVGKSAYHFAVSATAPQFWDNVEETVTGFAGRYIAFVLTTKHKRVYFDPVVDLPAVINQRAKTVASSPLMALDRPSRINHRVRQDMIMGQGGNYGMRQTCDPDVLRAVSNHYLDLESFSLHRHWPLADDAFDATADDLDHVAATISRRLGHIAGTILQNYDCALPLSGGADSRTLGFAAAPFVHHAKFAYSHRTNWISQFDCYVGKEVAAALGLADKFQIADAVTAIKSGTYPGPRIRRLRWNFCHRTGFQRPPINAELVGADLLPEADYILRGNILDMARANQWPKSFTFNLRHGLSKLSIGGRPAEENLAYWGPEYMNWVDTLPPAAHSRIYDFAFVEHLLPNTLGGRLSGYNNGNYLNPFNDRSLIKACMQVEPSVRKKGQLNRALHRACNVPDIIFARDAISDQAIKAEVTKLFA